MSLSLIKCKVCNKTISEPERIIGEPEEVHLARCIAKCMKHIQTRVNEELSSHDLSPNKPHCAVWQPQAISIFTYQMLLCSYLFTLTPELEAKQEQDRAGFHASTRRALKITDEDIRHIRLGIEKDWKDGATFVEQDAAHPRRNWEDAMRDLRDRYEEIGKYAPKQPAAPEPAPAVQD